MKKYECEISEEERGERLDVVAARVLAENRSDISRSALKNRDIPVLVNGKREKLSYRVSPGERVSMEIPDPVPAEIKAQDIPLEIVFRDKNIAVVNKPYGLTVHPARGHADGTLVNALLHHLKGKLSSVGGVERPGIVHRLDKDTAGLMIVALTDRAHRKLTEDFRDHRIKKTYHAVVKGETEPSGKIDMPIGRSPRDRKKMDVRHDGKPAVTEYRALEYLRDHTHVEINLLTGRTHQIRVHFSHIRHPVAGDPLYSRDAGLYRLTGIALFSKKLEFRHPVTGKILKFDAALPDEFRDLLKRLRLKKN